MDPNRDMCDVDYRKPRRGQAELLCEGIQIGRRLRVIQGIDDPDEAGATRRVRGQEIGVAGRGVRTSYRRRASDAGSRQCTRRRRGPPLRYYTPERGRQHAARVARVRNKNFYVGVRAADNVLGVGGRGYRLAAGRGNLGLQVGGRGHRLAAGCGNLGLQVGGPERQGYWLYQRHFRKSRPLGGSRLQGAFAATTPQQAYFVKCDAENNPPGERTPGS